MALVRSTLPLAYISNVAISSPHSLRTALTCYWRKSPSPTSPALQPPLLSVSLVLDRLQHLLLVPLVLPCHRTSSHTTAGATPGATPKWGARKRTDSRAANPAILLVDSKVLAAQEVLQQVPECQALTNRGLGPSTCDPAHIIHHSCSRASTSFSRLGAAACSTTAPHLLHRSARATYSDGSPPRFYNPPVAAHSWYQQSLANSFSTMTL